MEAPPPLSLCRRDPPVTSRGLERERDRQDYYCQRASGKEKTLSATWGEGNCAAENIGMGGGGNAARQGWCLLRGGCFGLFTYSAVLFSCLLRMMGRQIRKYVLQIAQQLSCLYCLRHYA